MSCKHFKVRDFTATHFLYINLQKIATNVDQNQKRVSKLNINFKDCRSNKLCLDHLLRQFLVREFPASELILRTYRLQ